jgi:hypothetical protein
MTKPPRTQRPETGRSTLPDLARPHLDAKLDRADFLALRGSAKGLWDLRPAETIAAMRDEWA